MIRKGALIARDDSGEFDITCGTGFLNNGQVIHVKTAAELVPFIAELIGYEIKIPRQKKSKKGRIR